MRTLLSLLEKALHVHWFAFHHSDENFYYYECRCGRRSYAYLPGCNGPVDIAWLDKITKRPRTKLGPTPRELRANALHRRAQKAEGQLQRMFRKLMELPQPADRVWVVWDRAAEAGGVGNLISTRRVFFSATEAEEFARSIGWTGLFPETVGTESVCVSGVVEVRVSCLPVR